MSNTKSHAERELEILVKTTPDAIIREFIPEIIALCEAFGKSGQSGGSAPYTAGAISQTVKKLCLHETIAPLTGKNDEWNSGVGQIEEKEVYQNNRLSSVFKDGKGGQAYYIDAVVFQGEEKYDSFTGSVGDVRSRQYIKVFPFTSKSFYIDVKKEYYKRKPDETKEYYEEDRTDGTKKYYKYVIKDPKQLEEVYAYYDKNANS